MTCRICGSTRVLNRHAVREMMYGTRETFSYVQCADCLCLQVEQIPVDLARHYEGGYYSYRKAERRSNPVKRWAGLTRDRHAVFGGGPVGAALLRRSPVVELESLRPLKLELNSRILDVGCGSGDLVFALGELGLKQVGGVDPYIPQDVTYDNGVTVSKRDIFEVEGVFDVVMFHHSFEHLADRPQVLRRAAQLLRPGGQCLLRVPTVSSHAWRQFGTNWVQLDAPRHLYLFARESIDFLAQACGFDVERVSYDSGAFQFWGSEQYRQDIPLHDERSHARNPGALFTPQQIAAWQARSAALNKQGEGDQAAFYLRRR